MKWLLRHPRTLALAARALGAYLQLALGSTRWTLHGQDELGALLLGGPAVFAFWHERLPLMPALWLLAKRERSKGPTLCRMHVLVSRHGDGRLIGDIMRRFGVVVIHGSTERGAKQPNGDVRRRGGAAGLRALLAALGGGGQVVITPDGPRGPRRQAAAGVAQLAALAGVPIVPCAAQTTSRTVLSTWDQMVLPLPLGRGVLVCGAPITVPRVGWEATLGSIEAALTAAAARADALCRA